jgi:hypothetical protein
LSMRAVTLIVAGPAGPADDVLQVVSSWVEAGLLQPVLWLRRGRASDAGGHGLVALKLEAGSSTEVGVLEELARHDVPTVRLLSVHLAVDAEVDPRLCDETDAVAGVLQSHLAASQVLERMNVVVPASGVTDLDPDLVSDPAVKHVVVSPEDRVSDRHASRPVLWPEGGYAGHAALAIATNSGLWWATGDAAPFDRESFTSSAERAQAVVTRSFARVLRAGQLGDQVTAEVFERRRTEAWTAAAVDGVDAPNPEQLTEELARGVGRLEDAAMSYREPQPLPQPKSKTVGVLEAFAMMFRFILGKLRDVPSQVAGRVTEGVRRAVEGFAQRVTFGQESLVQVGFGGRSLPGTDSSAPSLQAADYAAQLLRDLGRSTSPPATAGLWQAMRRVAFGLIDAGPFPAGIDAPSDGARRLVINDGSFVVADPDAQFEIDRVTLGHAHPLLAWALEPVPGWDVARLRDLRELLIDAHRLAERGGERETVLSEEPEQVEPDPELAQRLAAVLADLDRFAQRHQSSLLWRLSEQLSGSLRRASDSFIAALKLVRAGEPKDDGNKMALAARWLRRRWILVVLLALLVPAASWYAGEQGWWVPIWPPVVVSSLVVWLLGWFISFISYQRRIFRIQYEIDRRHHGYLNAIVRAEHDAFEMVRLASLYEQFLDWAAVIASMVHHPEGRLEPLQDDALPLPEQAPFALRVAEGIPSEETLQRTSAIIGRGVFNRGWLGGLYGAYAKEALRDLKHQLGLPDEAPNPDPDRDLATPPPRRFVLDQIERGVHATEWHTRVRAQVDVALGDLSPGELFDRVEPLTAEDAVPAGPAAAFLADALPEGSGNHALLQHLWHLGAQFSDPSRVTRTIMWAPEQLAPAGTAGAELHRAELADEAVAGAFVLAVIRCDVSAGSPAEDLALFRRRAPMADDADVVFTGKDAIG